MEASAVVSHDPPPSLEELSSLEIRLAKGSLTDGEYRTWLPRMIAAYKDLAPGEPVRDTPPLSEARGNG